MSNYAQTSGKSAIAARLTQIRDRVAAYHFCRSGDVEKTIFHLPFYIMSA
ncbi:hypothetical protein [Nostoc sp.]